MKINFCGQRERGLTLVEVLVISAVLIVLTSLLWPSIAEPREPRQRIQCIHNLKQIGLATRVWEGDHGDKYPWSVPGTNGGTMDFISGPNAWRHFQVMSNELSTPKVLLCPADDSRRVAATNFNFMNNSNVSYFVGIDAPETNPQSLLFGDRITNGTPIRNGILELTTNSPTGWTAEIHRKVGNIVLADGSVQQVSQNGLRQTLASTGAVTNRLLLPVLTP